MADIITMDTEYRRSAERNVQTLVVVTKLNNEEPKTWNCLDPDAVHWLLAYLQEHPVPVLCWSAQAECGALLALGVDVRKLQWIDGMVAWRMLRSGDERWKHHNKLTDVIRHYGITYTYDKSAHINLILSEQYTEHMTEIMAYCREDVIALYAVYEKINEELKVKGIRDADVAHLSRYSALLGIVERNGIPINSEYLFALCHNHDYLCDNLIYTLCSETYPFYIKRKGRYVESAVRFRRYLEKSGMLHSWPITEANRLSNKTENLETFGNSVLQLLAETKKLLNQLKWFKGKCTPEWLRAFGSDSRLRPYYNPYGTVTGRNAPSARQFIFAMSSWLRCLIRCSKGRVIVCLDYASQEFLWAALLSGDKVMLDGYLSGDPYLHWAKLLKAVPPDATSESHAAQRKVFKAVTLGLQYSMGARKLAHKVMMESGKPCTESEAREYVRLHHRTYPKYWSYIMGIEEKLARSHTKSVVLPDGWRLDTTSARKTTIRNWPIQGGAQMALRRAMMAAIDADLMVISVLHDAIYVECDAVDAENVTKQLHKIMLDAVQFYFPGAPMRIDEDVHTADEDWCEKKGRKYYEYFSKLLQWRQ
jgi:DNA polymerase I-like protein with 3'-5' exonuclease and polymerase domains